MIRFLSTWGNRSQRHAQPPRFPGILIVSLMMSIGCSTHAASSAAAESGEGSGDSPGDEIHDGGWEASLKLTVSIELKQENGTWQRVSPNRIFHSGDQFRIHVGANADLYLYVLVHNADGTDSLLVPETANDAHRVKANSSRRIPADGPAFEFQGQTGKEQLRVIASVKPFRHLAPERLFELEAKRRPTREEQAALSQLKDVQAKQVRRLLREQSRVKQVRSIEQAAAAIQAGTLERGLYVVAVEETDSAHIVTAATSDADGFVIADLELTHKLRD